MVDPSRLRSAVSVEDASSEKPRSSAITVFERLFAEADVRRFCSSFSEKIVGIVETEHAAEFSRIIQRHKLDEFIAVVSLDDATKNDIPQPIAWLFSPFNEESCSKLILKNRPKLSDRLSLLWRDIYPRAVSSGNVGEDSVDLSDVCFYMVVCTPRAGSTFLCELLQSGGAGYPKEHLRPPALDMIRCGYSVQRWSSFVNSVARSSITKGFFATKVISYFARDLEKELAPVNPLGALNWLPQPKILYLYRRDKLHQALSVHRAQATSYFHIRNEEDLAKYRNADWVYDYDSIHERYNSLWSEELRLSKLLNSNRCRSEVLTVAYEDLVLSPEPILKEIISFLGAERSFTSVAARVKKLSDDQTEERGVRFLNEYQRRNGRPLHRFFVPQ